VVANLRPVDRAVEPFRRTNDRPVLGPVRSLDPVRETVSDAPQPAGAERVAGWRRAVGTRTHGGDDWSWGRSASCSDPTCPRLSAPRTCASLMAADLKRWRLCTVFSGYDDLVLEELDLVDRLVPPLEASNGHALREVHVDGVVDHVAGDDQTEVRSYRTRVSGGPCCRRRRSRARDPRARSHCPGRSPPCRGSALVPRVPVERPLSDVGVPLRDGSDAGAETLERVTNAASTTRTS
jgi:hypothetical protein